MNESTRLLYKCIEGRYVKVTWSHKIQEIQGDIYLEKDRCVKNITCWLSVLTTGGALSSILSFIEPQISGSITAFLAILLSYFTVRYKDGQLEEKAKLAKISGITSKNGRNDAKRLNIRVVTVSNDDKPKNRKTQRKADLRRRMVCKSLPVKE